MAGDLGLNVSSPIERGALEAWYALYDLDRRPRREPDGPLHEKGGVFDPNAWCMKAAKAVAANRRPPRIYKNVQCPDWIVERIAEAMS